MHSISQLMPRHAPCAGRGDGHRRTRSIWGNPVGLGGRVAGPVMALLNAEMNQLTLDLMQPFPGDDVLEAGCGPGDLLQRLLRRVPEGRIVGVDPSAEMLRQAAGRNRGAAYSGRL